MILALTAAKGAPGVSTWVGALVAAWPEEAGRPVLLLDADVSGAGPTSEHLRHGLGDGRCLLRWAASAGRTPLSDEVVSLDDTGRRLLVPGLPDLAGGPVVAPHWGALLSALRALDDEYGGLDILVDLGRWGSRHEAAALLAGADAVVAVLRSDFASVSLTQGLCASLPRAADAALLVGERAPYSAREVSRALGVDVLGTMPIDARAADRLPADLRAPARTRSALVRSAAASAPRLAALAKERAGV